MHAPARGWQQISSIWHMPSNAQEPSNGYGDVAHSCGREPCMDAVGLLVLAGSTVQWHVAATVGLVGDVECGHALVLYWGGSAGTLGRTSDASLALAEGALVANHVGPVTCQCGTSLRHRQ